MKKFIAIALLLTMCLGLFAGCAQKPEATEPTTGSSLTAAKDYLRSMYKKTEGTKTVRDYDVVTSVAISGTTYKVDWTIEVTAGDKEAVALGETKDNNITIKIVNPKPAEEVKYALKGTLKDADGKTEEVKFEHYIPAVKVDPAGPVLVEKPEEGKAYKFVMRQENIEKTLYFTGEMKGKYMATTEDASKAVDMFVEAGKEGMFLYFSKDGKKQYIEIYEYENDEGKTKSGIRLSDKPVCEFVYNAECQNLVTKLAGGEYYIGTYQTFDTMSASSTSYIKPDNAGVSQFPAGLCTVNAGGSSLKVVGKPEEGKAYKMGMDQLNVGSILYFTGKPLEKTPWYIGTTENAGDAVDVFVEKSGDGFKLYFKDGDAKKYINIGPKGSHVNILIGDEGVVYTWNEELKTMVITVNEKVYSLGTRADAEYKTFSASFADNSFSAQFYA